MGVTDPSGPRQRDLREPTPRLDDDAERLDDVADREELRTRYYGLLQENRVLVPGVQVLVGFLIAVPFNGRFTEVDSLDLAREACAELGERVAVSGEGTVVQVDPDATNRALSRLAKAASRHGGIDSVTLVVRGPELEISPLLKSAAGVVTGEDLRELGAVVAVEHLKAIDVAVTAEDERLLIRFPG